MNVPGESAQPMNGLSAAADRLPEIIRRLRALYPDAQCELNHESPFQLLVATILSAQCTDERVNQVTPGLFARYPTPELMAGADPVELEEAIRPTGFYHQKARYIKETSHQLVVAHGGEVPSTMKELTALPGVARKTANVVLGVAYGLPEGVVVDTHVRRLSRRLCLTEEDEPEMIERDLMNLVPRSEWIDIGHLLIFHGRRVCFARRPNCLECPLNNLCPSVST
jgi:endonuclease-3